MGRDAASSAPERGGEILDEWKIVCLLDAAADGYDELGRAEVDGLRGAAEGLAGLGADLCGIECRREGVDFGAAPDSAASARKAPDCTETKHGPEPGGLIIAAETALHELAGEDGAVADCRDVADEDLAEARGESGGVVANLVGVREDEIVRRLGSDELLESGRESVGSVLRQQRMLDADDFGDALCGGFGREGSVCAPMTIALAFEPDCAASMLAAARASQLMRLMRPPRSSRTTQTPLIGRAPRTSVFRPELRRLPLAEPGMICVDFCFCGSVIFSSMTVGALACAEFSAAILRELPSSWLS